MKKINELANTKPLDVRDKKIEYALLDRQYEAEKEKLDSIILEGMASGQYILGKDIGDLEKEIARYCGTKYCVTVNSGTDALILGMSALGIGSGDEVITPPNSFFASTSSIIHLGAVPVFVDIQGDMNIDPKLIEKAITPKTKAIMPVHLTGRICAMDEIRSIARKHNLLVVEDAAQSFGSMYKGKKSGSFGDIGCFSAHPLKVFNACGDAGFITTNKEEVYKAVGFLRNHGFLTRTYIKKWGYVSRLDTVQARILSYRLTQVDEYIQRRRQNIELFRSTLNKKYITILPDKDYEYNSCQTFMIHVPNRDELKIFLADQKIEVHVHYPIPIHLQDVAKPLGYKLGDMPVTEKYSSRILSVPISQYLKKEEILYISRKINEFYER